MNDKAGYAFPPYILPKAVFGRNQSCTYLAKKSYCENPTAHPECPSQAIFSFAEDGCIEASAPRRGSGTRRICAYLKTSIRELLPPIPSARPRPSSLSPRTGVSRGARIRSRYVPPAQVTPSVITHGPLLQPKCLQPIYLSSYEMVIIDERP